MGKFDKRQNTGAVSPTMYRKIGWNIGGDRVGLFKEIVKEVQDEHGGIAPVEYIIKKAAEADIKEDVVGRVIQKLKVSGDIIEVSNGKFKVSP